MSATMADARSFPASCSKVSDCVFCRIERFAILIAMNEKSVIRKKMSRARSPDPGERPVNGGSTSVIAAMTPANANTVLNCAQARIATGL